MTATVPCRAVPRCAALASFIEPAARGGQPAHVRAGDAHRPGQAPFAQASQKEKKQQQQQRHAHAHIDDGESPAAARRASLARSRQANERGPLPRNVYRESGVLKFCSTRHRAWTPKRSRRRAPKRGPRDARWSLLLGAEATRARNRVS